MAITFAQFSVQWALGQGCWFAPFVSAILPMRICSLTKWMSIALDRKFDRGL